MSRSARSSGHDWRTACLSLRSARLALGNPLSGPPNEWATTYRLLRRFVPHIEERVVAGSGNVTPALSSRTVERRSHVLFGVCQLCQWHLEGDALLHLIEIRQDLGHDRFVLPMATLRYVSLRHAFEVH